MPRRTLLAALSASLFAACGPADATLEPAQVAPPPTAAPEATPAPPTSPVSLPSTGVTPSWMDRSADACADFYQLACGGLLKDVEIPADQSSWGPTQELQENNEKFLRSTLETAVKSANDHGTKKLGAWYGACMDEPAIEKAGIKPLKPLLSVVAAVKNEKTLHAAVIALHKRAIFPFFDISSQQDFKDATLVIAGLDQDGLGLPDRDYYLNDDAATKEIRTFYQGHVERMFALLGHKPAAAKKEAEEVLRIETAVARIQQDKVIRRDPYKIYNKVDRKGLAKAAKRFPWDAYFGSLGFPDIKDVSINSVEYFSGIDDLMRKEKPEALKSYLTWMVVAAESGRLSSGFVKEGFAMKQKLTGQKEMDPRWRRCVHSADHALGEILAQQYVAAKFDEPSKHAAEGILKAVRGSMGTELGTLLWMDAETRRAAQDKLARMNEKIGYPSRWKAYDFEITADHGVNGMTSDGYELARSLRKVGKPLDRGDWQMTPPEVNAYYDPSLNEMVFPAGILQAPFFGKGFAAATNFGAIGSVMGHELTHGFDDEGSQFDGAGNLRNWWSEGTGKLFKDQTRCVIDQYSGYEAVPGVHLNGELTAGENIADIGGLKLSYAAYKAARRDATDRFVADGYSEDQVFFLAYGQSWCTKMRPELLELMAKTNPHSPARYRVNGVVADTPGFGDAFSCKVGAPMRPEKACAVW